MKHHIATTDTYIDLAIKNATFERSKVDGTIVIRVKGIEEKHVNWPAVEEVLTSANISKEDAMMYVEMFAGKVQKMELAKALAELVTIDY